MEGFQRERQIALSWVLQHPSVSVCLCITHNSSPSRSLYIRHEGVRTVYFIITYMLLTLMMH